MYGASFSSVIPSVAKSDSRCIEFKYSTKFAERQEKKIIYFAHWSPGNYCYKKKYLTTFLNCKNRKTLVHELIVKQPYVWYAYFENLKKIKLSIGLK